uniref:Uncharacterized protein n=1 Tax=Phlebotomus papatasi TaxID=29031 RepID=A0A1B0DBR6_PHLPP
MAFPWKLLGWHREKLMVSLAPAVWMIGMLFRVAHDWHLFHAIEYKSAGKVDPPRDSNSEEGFHV